MDAASAAKAAEKPHCGETCPVLDFMTVVCNDRMTFEERMEAAIKACTDPGDGVERMSQRAAAKKFNVSQAATFSNHLAKVITDDHPTTSPAPQEKSDFQEGSEGSKAPAEGLKEKQKRGPLRALVRDNGGTPRGLCGPGQGLSSLKARAWLDHIGVPIPPELDGNRADISEFLKTRAAAQAVNSTSQDDDIQEQGLQAGDPETGEDEAADELDYGIERERDLRELLACPNTSDSLKQAFQLLYNGHTIIGQQFFGKGEWDGHDWVRINSSVEAIRSLTRQRAEEFHRRVFSANDQTGDRKITVVEATANA